MRPHLLRLGKLPPRLDQQSYGLGGVGRPLSDALQYCDLLPYLAQEPFRAVTSPPGQRPVLVERVAGKRDALDGVGGHDWSIAERAGLVNPAHMSLLARILLIAGILGIVLGIVLSLVLIARPLIGG